MAYKQIIIDGIDVSGCEHYDEVCLGNHHYKWCKDNSNCYYKQLKYIEQTLDYREKTYLTNLINLTNETNFLREKLHSKEQECEELKVCLFQVQNSTISLTKQLDQLKAELEQYKNVINKLAGKTVAITTYDTPTEFCDHKDLTIQQLKVENEDLKNTVDYLRREFKKIKWTNKAMSKQCENLNCKDLQKLKKTLTEIKELLLKTPTDSPMHCVNAKSVILQKISEVIE